MRPAAGSGQPPFRVRRVDLAAIAAGLLVYVVPNLFSHRLVPRPRTPKARKLNPIDRRVVGKDSNLADLVGWVAMFGALGLPVADALRRRRRVPVREELVVYAETLAVNEALTTVAKYLVQRPLPRVYGRRSRRLRFGPAGYRSFFSGHDAATSASLAFWRVARGARGESRASPSIALGLMAPAMGVSRVLAGRHFPTDAAVGVLAGTLIGTAVPALHRPHRRASQP